MKGRRERNVLFNDTINTFYLRLYGVRHMVKDHSDSEKGNPLLPHRLLFPINSKGSFIYMHHPTDRITHTMAFVTPVMEHWLEQDGSTEHIFVIWSWSYGKESLSEGGNPLPPHGLLFPISSKCSFICTIPQTG